MTASLVRYPPPSPAAAMIMTGNLEYLTGTKERQPCHYSKERHTAYSTLLYIEQYRVQLTMYTVQCTVHCVHCTVHGVHCTVYGVRLELYNITVQCRLLSA